MNQPPSISRQTFMHVKKRLDYYRLPSSFPMQSIQLIQKLLSLLDQSNREKLCQKQNSRYQQLRSQHQSDSLKNNGQFRENLHVQVQALQFEMKRYIKQINALNDEIILLKEQLYSQKHVASKGRMENIMIKNTFQKQYQNLQENRNGRQNYLFSELQSTKYKYNQLMDLVHEQSNTQKVYIKKLLKNKRYSLNKKQYSPAEKNQSIPRTNMKDNLIGNGATRQEKLRVNNSQNFAQYSESNNELSQLRVLKNKLQNRQNQIRRLRNNLQVNGPDINRILKSFNDNKNRDQRQNVKQRHEYLQVQNKKLKDQIQKMKKQAGGKQALRQHIDKVKSQNQGFKSKLNQLNKKNKERDFDLKKQQVKNKRTLKQTKDKLDHILKQGAKKQIDNEQKLKNTVGQGKSKQNDRQLRVRRVQEQLQRKQEQYEELQRQVQDLELMHQYEKQKLRAKQQNQMRSRHNKGQERQSGELVRERLLRQNQLLRETVSKLQQVNEQLMSERGNQLNEVTGFAERSTLQIQVAELNRRLIETKNEMYAKQALVLRREKQLFKKQGQVVKCQGELRNVQNYYQLQKGQNQHLRGELERLRDSFDPSLTESALGEVRREKQSYKDLLELQKSKNHKHQAQIQQYSTLVKDFDKLKDQYHALQKSHKDNVNGIKLRSGQLQQLLNDKAIRLQQQQLRINSLERELIQAAERVRQANSQMSKMDDQLHLVKLERSRAQQKYTQLYSQFTASQQRHNNTSALRQTQLSAQLQHLLRQNKTRRLIIEQQQVKINQLLINQQKDQETLILLHQQVQLQKHQLENRRQSEELCLMEIRELRKSSTHNQ